MRDDQSDESDEWTAIDRRSVMKAVGGGTVGLTVLAGTATATGKNKDLSYQFYGCSQVCVDRDRKVTAVVWTGKKFRFACIARRSNRNDPPVRDWKDVYCYGVTGKEAVVGVYYEGEFVENPNRCAENYPRPEKCKSACY